jgi:hypothetical protein
MLQHLVVLILGVTFVSSGGPASRQSPVTPTEPVSAVLKAFDSHELVAVPGGHLNTAVHAFTLALIRDRRFTDVVDDVIVEWGNARYQDLADRFVNGRDVAYADLRRIWMDNTQAAPTDDNPQAEEILRAVRAVNVSTRGKRRVRVILGDPPIDWSVVHTAADHRKWIAQRETFPADVIAREVLARRRRGLILYGVGHLQRKNPQANFDSAGPAASLVSLLEEDRGVKVFNVGLMLDPPSGIDVTTWPVPSLIALDGTSLGDRNVVYNGPRVSVRDGAIVPVSPTEWRSMTLKQQWSALLYIGPRTSWSDATVSAALCADPAWGQMRTERMAIAQWTADRLEDYCGRPWPMARQGRR